MHTKPGIEPTARRRTVPAELLSVVRGDKSMADAYPPAAPRGTASPASHTKDR